MYEHHFFEMTNAYAYIYCAERKQHCVRHFYWASEYSFEFAQYIFWLLPFGCVDFITPQLNFLATPRHDTSTKRTVENKHTFLSKKGHIIFQKEDSSTQYAHNTHLPENPMVCHEFSTDNCIVSVYSWNSDLKPRNTRA